MYLQIYLNTKCFNLYNTSFSNKILNLIFIVTYTYTHNLPKLFLRRTIMFMNKKIVGIVGILSALLFGFGEQPKSTAITAKPGLYKDFTLDTGKDQYPGEGDGRDLTVRYCGFPAW